MVLKVAAFCGCPVAILGRVAVGALALGPAGRLAALDPHPILAHFQA